MTRPRPITLHVRESDMRDLARWSDPPDWHEEEAPPRLGVKGCAVLAVCALYLAAFWAAAILRFLPWVWRHIR